MTEIDREFVLRVCRDSASDVREPGDEHPSTMDAIELFADNPEEVEVMTELTGEEAKKFTEIARRILAEMKEKEETIP